MEKTVKEIMRETLIELAKIMLEAFDAGVNMDYDTRDAGTERAWITGSITLEGWTNITEDSKGLAYRKFEIYNHHSESQIREKLESIRKDVEEMSKYEIRNVYAIVSKR